MAITEQEWFRRVKRYGDKLSKETDCKFCIDYKYQRYIDKQSRFMHDDIKLKSKYTLSLVSHMCKNGGFASTHTKSGYPVRYCPMCGKKLARK